MFIVLALLAAQSVLDPPAILDLRADRPPFDIKQSEALNRQFCAGEWPNDFRMQDYCFRQAVEGMSEFADASRAVGRPLDVALEKCVEDWTKAGVPDFRMIGYCAKQQAEAYRLVHPGS
jgi:hypothetical protein